MHYIGPTEAKKHGIGPNFDHQHNMEKLVESQFLKKQVLYDKEVK